MYYEENKHGAFVPQIRVDSTVQVPAPTEQSDTWQSAFVTQIDDVLDDGTAILTDEYGEMHQIKISRLKLV
jgi:hypothetical protein